MRTPILILMSAIGVIGANSLLLSPVVSAVSQTLNATTAEVMRAASAYGLGVAAAALLLAPLADRIGAGRLLRAALLLLGAGLAASAAAADVRMLMAAQAVCGLAAGAALPSIYTLAMVIAPKGREARVLGLVLSGWTVSLVLGVSVSAWATDLAGWRAVYGTLAAVALLLWAASASLRAAGSPSSQATSPLTALRVPGIVRGLLSTALMMLGFYSSYFFTGAHITQGLGLSITQAGLLPLFYGIGFGLAVLLDPLLDRLGLARATPPVFLAVTASYLLMMVWADSYGLLLGLAVLWGIGQHLALNLVVARVTLLDPGQRGAIMGLFSTVTYLCVFAAPFTGAAAYAVWGLAGCLGVSALLSASAALEALGLKPAAPSAGGAPA
ncbi:MFS transporter [Leisingera aquaemixtae]|uniref:Purine efflux pump PbuE n=1 Tax=Leisingera aquaemixtae TaxID=1396826 RepID=A0A0P1HEX0_9RHOB|nr:MFS transporter [Leisingera aquaemixtae]CUI02100.1 Purine efflux pump PbuE [Leisingera aquaemixtae]